MYKERLKKTLNSARFFAGCLLQFSPLFLQAQQHSAIPGGRHPLPNEAKEAILPHRGVPVLEDSPLSSSLSKGEALEMDRISEILYFWFGHLPGPDFFPSHKMAVWFSSTSEIERQMRDSFFQDIVRVGGGEYNSWRDNPRGRLALILLLDQIPRHLYRNQPQAFRFDRMAQALVLEGIQKGDDKMLYPVERAFFYLPLEHAEDLNLQNLSVASYQQLAAEAPASIQPQMQDFLQSAIAHRQQIARFGRFPSRNMILDRKTTSEERVFLMQ